MLSLLMTAAPALVPALVAVFGLAVALTARRRVLAAAGAVVSTGVFAGFAYVGGAYGYHVCAWLLGGAAALNLLLGVALATERRAPSRNITGGAR